MRRSRNHRLPTLLSGALTCFALAATALAAPYATALEHVAGALSFILNAPADNVKIVRNDGTLVADLGALPKGAFATNIDLVGPFGVVVSRNAPSGWVQTSDDAAPTVRFNSPRGLAVNRNPRSPYFGRVYISNSSAGTAGGRTLGDGIYVLNADQTDATGQGNAALTGGFSFASSPGASPYRLAVGEDDNLYICDWSDATGGLVVTDPNVSTDGAAPVLKPLTPGSTGDIGAIPLGLDNTHGSIAAVVALGSLAQGNLTLYLIDQDLQEDRSASLPTQMNSLWRFDVGAGPLPSSVEPNLPRLMTPDVGDRSQIMDLDRGPDGKCYIANRRPNGNENNVFVVDAAGAVLWKSREQTIEFDPARTTDLLADSGALTVSADGAFLAVCRYGNSAVTVLPLVNGLPDFAHLVTFPAFGPTAAARAIAFDAAGNLHVLSSGYALYRTFSPGGSTVATTSSDGTFTLRILDAVVTVAASSPATTEGSPTPAEFTLTRTGDLATALTVEYNVTGTATADSDYTPLPGSVTFAAGADTAIVTVNAIEDSIAELAESVTITVLAGSAYSAGTPAEATVAIADNDPPALSIATLHPSAYERVAGDHVTFRLTRLGNADGYLTVNLAYQGTAPATDYSAPPTVEFAADQATVDLYVFPIDNPLLDGDRTLIATLIEGEGYTIGAPNAATATILDDEYPPEDILWSEDFNTDAAPSWTARFASANGIDDYRIGGPIDATAFSYDYASGAWCPAVPPAPHSAADTLGLYLTVNKDENTPLGAAAINLYPTAMTFSGDFAVRFDMYLMVGADADTTEYALFGINHSATNVNWFRSDGTPPGSTFDGLFYGVAADGAARADYALYSAPATAAGNPTALAPPIDAATLADIFKSPPWQAAAGPGAPANSEITATPSWADVEIRHGGNLVTLTINRTPIMTCTNTTPFSSGHIMLGYCDAYDSVMTGNSCVIYDNLRVVRLPVVTSPVITAIHTTDATAQVHFAAAATDTPDAFALEAASSVAGAYTNVAAIITGDNGNFIATRAIQNSQQFYRVKRL